MAKVLISVNNSTNKVVSIHLRSSSMSPSRQHFTFGDGATHFPKDGVNIPDNCDPARYFDTERLEVVIGDSHEFSLWVDDGDNFRIRQCEGNKWRQSEYLVGGDTGGDGALVSLHIGCDSHGKYHLKAVNVTAHPQTSLFAKGLHVLNLIYLGLPKQAGDQNTTLAATMQTEEFKTLAGIANEYGFKSIGLVVGVDAALVIGFETMAGLITGTLAQEELLLLDSTGVSVSLEEGARDFMGLYLSTDAAESSVNVEFFSEMVADVGRGYAATSFITFTGHAGLLIVGGVSDEISLSVGVGVTTVGRVFSRFAPSPYLVATN